MTIKNIARSLFIRKGAEYYYRYEPENPFEEPGPRHFVTVIDVKKGRGTFKRFVKYRDLESDSLHSEEAVEFITERKRYRYGKLDKQE